MDPKDSYIGTKNELSKDPKDQKWLRYGTESLWGPSNGAHAFKNHNKKVIFDGETIDHRSP